jgi:predicted DNA-binding protein
MTTSKKQIGLRLPQEFIERLEAAAERADRSVNAEITRRLERSFLIEFADCEICGRVARAGKCGDAKCPRAIAPTAEEDAA